MQQEDSYSALVGKAKISVASQDAARFNALVESANVTAPYLFATILDAILLEDIEFFIRVLSIKYKSEPFTIKQLVQLSVLYSLLGDIAASIGGFD